MSRSRKMIVREPNGEPKSMVILYMVGVMKQTYAASVRSIRLVS